MSINWLAKIEHMLYYGHSGGLSQDWKYMQFDGYGCGVNCRFDFI